MSAFRPGAYLLAEAVLLFGYGLSLNLAPIEFHRVAGIYIATLFIVWQIISFLVLKSVPTIADPRRRRADRYWRSDRLLLEPRQRKLTHAISESEQ